MSRSNDDPPDWVKFLTPKLTEPTDDRVAKLAPEYQDALKSLFPVPTAKPKVEVEPLGADVINYLKEERLPDSEESLYDYGIRKTNELNRLGKEPIPPEPLLEILYTIRKRDNLVRRHAKEWIVGNHLEERWDISEDILRGTVLAELPVYKIMLDETSFELLEKVPARDARIWEHGMPNPSGLPWGGSTPDPLALTTNWWFKWRDVKFYEVLHPEIGGVATDYEFVTPIAVETALQINTGKLRKLVIEHGLPSYRLDSKQGVVRSDENYVRRHGFHGCLFSGREVFCFDQDNPDLCGLRRKLPSQEAKEKSIDYAQARWKRDHDLTTSAIAREIRDFEWAKAYGGKNTIWDWIHPYNPNPRKGKRSKKQTT